MPKYHVYAAATGTIYLGEYEAETPEKAVEMAENSDKCATPTLCHQCSREVDLGDIHSVEAELS
jgi:hypothetical protein